MTRLRWLTLLRYGLGREQELRATLRRYEPDNKLTVEDCVEIEQIVDDVEHGKFPRQRK